MLRTNQLGLRALLAIAALAALGAALLASLAIARSDHSAAKPPDRGAVCPTAEEPAEELTVLELRRSVRCLINTERAIRGRAKLDRDDRLQDAAQRHSATMVETGCLAHRCGDELDLETRIRRAGYFEGAEAWQYAENTGCGLSAEAMVANWMASRFHRINLLEKTFIDVGVGVTQEPVATRCDVGYATFALVFGWRDPA